MLRWGGGGGQGTAPLRDPYPPIIIHHRDEQADLVHVLRRDVEDDGLIVDGIERVLLYGGFLLLQPPPVTEQGHLDVWVCADKGGGREGSMLNMSSDTTCSRGTEAPHLLLLLGCPQRVGC